MTTPRPIPIPRDLKPGDVIVDAKNERHTCRRVNGDSCYDRISGHLWTAIDDNVCSGRWFQINGHPYGQRAFAVRIERIASKARKAKVAPADKAIAYRWAIRLALDMLMDEDKHKRIDAFNRILAVQRNPQRIARRLNGGGK